MTEQPGVRVIAGRYRLIAQEGEGGMATVWRAMDEQLEREVAVKILRPQFGADPGFATRFRNEARAAGALSHPNVVQVYDFGTDAESGDQYIVMQLVEGQDLATVLKERGPLEIDEAVAIGAAVADALDAAHRHGLIHRDIKPGNILLTASGRALVADFGISRAIADAAMTVTGTTIGSVHYFSPEQASGEEVGPPVRHLRPRHRHLPDAQRPAPVRGRFRRRSGAETPERAAAAPLDRHPPDPARPRGGGDEGARPRPGRALPRRRRVRAGAPHLAERGRDRLDGGSRRGGRGRRRAASAHARTGLRDGSAAAVHLRPGRRRRRTGRGGSGCSPSWP